MRQLNRLCYAYNLSNSNKTLFQLSIRISFSFSLSHHQNQNSEKDYKKNHFSVLFVVNVRDIFIPTSAASQALSILFRRRTSESFLRNSRSCQAETLGNRRGRLAFDHQRRQANRQVLGKTSVPLHELRNETVFPRRKPESDVRKALRHVGDLLQMLHALHVATVMPAKETAGFGHGDCKDHRLFPKRVEKGLESPLKSGLHVRERIPSLQGVAFGADAPDHVSELHSRHTTLRGNRPRLTRHLRRFRKVADNFQGLSKCHHGQDTSRDCGSLQVFSAKFLRESSPTFPAFLPTKRLTRRGVSEPTFFCALSLLRSSAGF